MMSAKIGWFQKTFTDENVSGVHNVVTLTITELLQIAAVLVAIGTLAMALLELLKSVLRGRRIYNRWAVLQWTSGNRRTVGGLLTRALARRDNQVLAELELLALGGHEDSGPLYDQPVEKMMGQIQAAVNVAFEFPNAYPHLYGFITSVPSTFYDRKAGGGTRDDQLKWQQGVQQVRKVQLRQQQEVPPSSEETAAAVDATQARSRLSNLVARKLDAFQNEIQYFWERLNQWVAGPIASLIFFVSYKSFIGENLTDPSILVLSVMAGILAPYAKDFSSSLASFGK
jgi:hypothetical protein